MVGSITPYKCISHRTREKECAVHIAAAESRAGCQQGGTSRRQWDLLYCELKQYCMCVLGP